MLGLFKNSRSERCFNYYEDYTSKRLIISMTKLSTILNNENQQLAKANNKLEKPKTKTLWNATAVTIKMVPRNKVLPEVGAGWREV